MVRSTVNVLLGITFGFILFAAYAILDRAVWPGDPRYLLIFAGCSGLLAMWAILFDRDMPWRSRRDKRGYAVIVIVGSGLALPFMVGSLFTMPPSFYRMLAPAGLPVLLLMNIGVTLTVVRAWRTVEHDARSGAVGRARLLLIKSMNVLGLVVCWAAFALMSYRWLPWLPA